MMPVSAATPPFLTKHAVIRCQQRGISVEVINFVLMHFDRDFHAGGGVSAISVSKNKLQTMQNEGHSSPRLLECAGRTVLLISDDGAIVTVINRPTWHGRFYRGAERLSFRRFACHRRRSRRH